MTRKSIVLAIGLASVAWAWADSASSVTTTERIGLAYNQLGVNVTVANPSGVTAVAGGCD